MEHDGKNIILFDGVCNLCNGFIDYVIKRDDEKQFYFMSLQSDAATDLLKGHAIEKKEDDFSTIYLHMDGELYSHSTAVLKIARKLGGVKSTFASIALKLPLFLRNGGYRFVANNRYRFFGKKETCRLPTPEERAQFIQ